MGNSSSISTRSSYDYVYVYTDVDSSDHVSVNFFVTDTDSCFKLRTFTREQDDLKSLQIQDKAGHSLPKAEDPRKDVPVFVGLYTSGISGETPYDHLEYNESLSCLENRQVCMSTHVTKTLEELVLERET
jgi:hypothetical protein